MINSKNSYYEYIKTIRSHYLNHFDKGLKVLDIGCGDGVFMEYLDKEGYDVFGLDTSTDAVESCKKKQLSVFNENALSFLQKKEDSFGSIMCSHLIEHISIDEIHNLIESCYNALANNGILVILTPNVKTLLGGITFWDDPTHIRPYTTKSLEKLFRDKGFSNVMVGYEETTKIKVRKDFVHLIIDIIRIIAGFLFYGKPALYNEISVIAQK